MNLSKFILLYISQNLYTVHIYLFNDQVLQINISIYWEFIVCSLPSYGFQKISIAYYYLDIRFSVLWHCSYKLYFVHFMTHVLTSLKTYLCQTINLAGALMEQHFQAKLRLWYSEEKISIFYYYFSITFELYFQGIIPLRHLLMKKLCSMSWQRSVIKEIGKWLGLKYNIYISHQLFLFEN